VLAGAKALLKDGFLSPKEVCFTGFAENLAVVKKFERVAILMVEVLKPLGPQAGQHFGGSICQIEQGFELGDQVK